MKIVRSKNILLLAVLGLYFSGCKPENKTEKPNIIFIIGDDISAEDIGIYGNQSIRTPHIDQLGKDGLKFNNLFLTASSCSLSRTSILTGRYPHNTGAAELHTPLPAHLTFFPDLLKHDGYYTALAGKWHEGENSRRAYDTLLVSKKENGEGGEDQWISLLDVRPKDKPFFFWLAPYDAHREWSDSSAFKKPYTPSDVKVPPTLIDDIETRRDLANYYNEISRVDDFLGKIQTELQRQGIAENTIIIFTADNARPFPGSKTRLLDRGLKAPFLIKWPKGIRNKAESVDALVSSIDIAPTLLDLAGVKPTDYIQGKSFSKLLKDPKTDFRKYVFGEHNWHDYEAYERSVRTADFLYLINQRPQLTNEGPIDANQSPSAMSLKKAKAKGSIDDFQNEIFLNPRAKEELFDNKKDPLQKSNLAGDPYYKKQKAKLKEILLQWQKETGDTAPGKITPDWYDRSDGKELPAKGKRGEMPGQSANADRVTAKGPF